MQEKTGPLREFHKYFHPKPEIDHQKTFFEFLTLNPDMTRYIFPQNISWVKRHPMIWKWAKLKLWQVVILWWLTLTWIGPQWGQFFYTEPWKCVVSLPLVLWNRHAKCQPSRIKIVDFFAQLQNQKSFSSKEVSFMQKFP